MNHSEIKYITKTKDFKHLIDVMFQKWKLGNVLHHLTFLLSVNISFRTEPSFTLYRKQSIQYIMFENDDTITHGFYDEYMIINTGVQL